MPDLSFQMERAEAVPYAAAPLLIFKLRVANAEANEPIHSVFLRCQIQIEASGDHVEDPEQGPASTSGGLLWSFVEVSVPSFTGATVVDLPVPCSFDFNVAALNDFPAREGGEVPLRLLFSGTILVEEDSGDLQVVPTPWNQEAHFRLPVTVWNEMMDLYYPDRAWVRLRRAVFHRLYRYKVQRGLPTWEHALERLLTRAEGAESP